MSCQVAKTEYWKIMIWLSDTKCCHLAMHYVLPKYLPSPNLQFRFMKSCVHMSLLGSLCVTWPQSVYFLRKMCLFFNFWMIKFTIMCFFDIHTWNFSSKVLYMSKNHNSFKKYTNWAKLSYFWGKCVFWLSWEISCMNVKKRT